MGARDFVDLIAQAAQPSANMTGVPASFTVAEAIFEMDMWRTSSLPRKETAIPGLLVVD